MSKKNFVETDRDVLRRADLVAASLKQHESLQLFPAIFSVIRDVYGSEKRIKLISRIQAELTRRSKVARSNTKPSTSTRSSLKASMRPKAQTAVQLELL